MRCGEEEREVAEMYNDLMEANVSPPKAIRQVAKHFGISTCEVDQYYDDWLEDCRDEFYRKSREEDMRDKKRKKRKGK